MQELTPYELSPVILQVLIDATRTSDVFLLGELHEQGYRELALEIPRYERDALESSLSKALSRFNCFSPSFSFVTMEDFRQYVYAIF